MRTAPRRWNHARDLSSNATYRAEAFWEAAEGAGFTPQAAIFVPYQRLNQQSNYAYFLMTKGSSAVAAPRQEAMTPAGIPAADGQPFGRST